MPADRGGLRVHLQLHRRLAWTIGLVLLAALAVTAALIVPPWLPLLVPEATMARARLGFLRALQAAYATLVVLALAGTAALAPAVIRARRRGGRRPMLNRLLLFSGTCLAGIVMVELCAGAWLAWAHRMPRLPSHAEGPLGAAWPRLPTRMAKGPENSLYLVVIGGSTARGAPYDPALSIGQIVSWQLERVFPGRQVDVEILARPGISLKTAHLSLAGLARRPDAILVYSGHNEFQERYTWYRSVPYYDDDPENSASHRLLRTAVGLSPLSRLISETLDQQGVGEAPDLSVRHEVIENPTCTAQERARLRADFERRLDAIASYCERIGALPILFRPAGNEAGFEPNRSVVSPHVLKPERDALTREFLKARALEDSDPAASQARYEALLARQPGFAEVHFRLGKLLERAGHPREARVHYRQAVDHDGMPLRCPSEFQAAYDRVARAHPQAILIDAEAVLRKLDRNGLLDDRLFHDAHHPTLRGYVALAQALLDRLAARGALGWPVKVPAPVIDPAECAAQFQITAPHWMLVCERTMWFYRTTAGLRFDPRRRLARLHAYTRARQQLAAGKPAERIGLPGLGVTAREFASRSASPEDGGPPGGRQGAAPGPMQ